jgi:hypothetical protein
LRPAVAIKLAITLLNSGARRNRFASNHPFRVTTAHSERRDHAEA